MPPGGVDRTVHAMPGGQIPQGRVLPFRVVTFDPGRDDAFGLLEGLEMVQPDTFLLQGSEEALDHPVVLRRVAGDELLNDRELLGGADKEAGQENRAVVVASWYKR